MCTHTKKLPHKNTIFTAEPTVVLRISKRNTIRSEAQSIEMCEETRPLCHIRGFHKFLEQCLKRTVLNYTLKALTKPGDNYGSVMQAVDVKVAGINDSSEVNWFIFKMNQMIFIPYSCDLQAENMVLVAKTAVTNPYLVDIFQPALTFVKEAHFYSDIIPAIEEFECASNVPENEKIDAFIKCFGSRISLNPGEQWLNIYEYLT